MVPEFDLRGWLAMVAAAMAPLHFLRTTPEVISAFHATAAAARSALGKWAISACRNKSAQRARPALLPSLGSAKTCQSDKELRQQRLASQNSEPRFIGSADQSHSCGY